MNQSQTSVLVGRTGSLAVLILLSPAMAFAANGNESNRPDRGACTQQMIERGLRNDHLASVLLVKEFKQGDPLLLSGTPTANTPRAASDLCFAKINVGPGNPGPVGAPSTSPESGSRSGCRRRPIGTSGSTTREAADGPVVRIAP